MRLSIGFYFLLILWCSASLANVQIEDPATFWTDGGLTRTNVRVDDGSVEFVINQGLVDGRNFEMIFGSSLSRANPGGKVLWHRAQRAKLFSEVFLLLAQLPSPEKALVVEGQLSPIDTVQRNQNLLRSAGFTTEEIGTITDFLLSVKNVYQKIDPAAGGSRMVDPLLHNKTVTLLRRFSKFGKNNKLPNLQSLGRWLEGAALASQIYDLSLGAAVQAALYSDDALQRMKLLEDVFSTDPDPAVREALHQAHWRLELTDSDWGALLSEMIRQQDQLIQMVYMKMVQYLCTNVKLLGIKGYPLYVTIEIFLSEVDQHQSAEYSVISATVEDKLRNSTLSFDMQQQCEIIKMALLARFLFFDRMFQVCDVWQGKWVDLLSRGQPYKDARDYFNAEKKKRELALNQAGEVPCIERQKVNANQIILVIDSSGSMQTNDPHGIRIEASQLLVDRLGDNDQLGLLDFDAESHLLTESVLPITRNNRDRIRELLARVDSAGGTDISKALKSAYELLLRSQSASTINNCVILLTDGQGAYFGEAELFAKKNWPIYTIGLSNEVNEELLNKIARLTNGRYFKASDTTYLQLFFDLISSDLKGEVTVKTHRDSILPGETKEVEFFVDPTMSGLFAQLSWVGSDIDMVLKDPTGTLWTPEKNVSAKTYELLNIPNPRVGIWKGLIHAVDVPASGELFVFRISTQSTSQLQLGRLNESYKVADKVPLKIIPIELPAQFQQQRASADILTPSGKMQRLQFAEGTINPLNPTSGSPSEMSATFTPLEPGDYFFTICWTGRPANGSAVSRELLFTLHVTGKTYKVNTEDEDVFIRRNILE